MLYGTRDFFFGLFYSRYWVIFPIIENSIFFSNSLEEIPNLNYLNLKNVWNMDYIPDTVLKWLKWLILDSDSLCSFNQL